MDAVLPQTDYQKSSDVTKYNNQAVETADDDDYDALPLNDLDVRVCRCRYFLVFYFQPTMSYNLIPHPFI
jgi:hypothetical protein